VRLFVSGIYGSESAPFTSPTVIGNNVIQIVTVSVQHPNQTVCLLFLRIFLVC